MDLYQQNILDYYKHPRYRGSLEVSVRGEVANPLCGDRLAFYLTVSQNRILKAVWQGEGCVLSLAAADMLAEHIQGSELSALVALDRAWMLKTLGVEPSPSRTKCALLALDAVRAALASQATSQA